MFETHFRVVDCEEEVSRDSASSRDTTEMEVKLFEVITTDCLDYSLTVTHLVTDCSSTTAEEKLILLWFRGGRTSALRVHVGKGR